MQQAANTSMKGNSLSSRIIKEEVASRAPRRGARLEAEKQRKRQASSAQKSKSSKRRKGPTDRLPADGTIAVGGAINDDNEDEEFCSVLVLMYNIARGYCSAISGFGHTKYPGGCIRQADHRRLP